MEHWLSRTELLLGKERIGILSKSHVLIAGLGGVGGYAAEQLCRAGIGELTIIDGDKVTLTNLNRQILALCSNQGQYKADLMAQRLRDINPDVKLHIIAEYLKEDRFPAILGNRVDYVVDAIDTLTPKVTLLVEAVKKGYPVVSSMGSGGKLQPERVEICDISETNHCKFASIVRKYLHRMGVYKGITAIYSPEPVSKKAVVEVTGEENKRSAVGTISYMPPVFGCFCASVVIRDLIMQEGFT
jgi:tRNA threonylcarbamoyladenosine dehydratase